MTKTGITQNDAARTSAEAGAPQPVDALCVTGLRGVAPASLRGNLAPRVWAASRIPSL